MDETLQRLRDTLTSSHTLPVLFVGSGLSQRYLSSPTWVGLLEQAASLTGRSFNYYEGLAAEGPKNRVLPRVASRIARDFYDTWFDDATYSSSRARDEVSVQRESDPLKIELARYLSDLTLTHDEHFAVELEKLATVRAHAVITTNYDSILEDALPDMEVYVGQQTILFSATQSVGEIYKIHGSLSDPTSMVLTDEDYDEYWSRNPYLVAKILTLFVEHPIIFLGYSLSDAHIQRILGNLVACLTESQLRTLNKRFIFVSRETPSRSSGLRDSTITVDEHSFQVQELTLSNYGDLYDLLSTLPQHFPVRLLRQLKENVYQLTFSSEPTGRVYVLPFEEAQEDEVEVVVGVGTMDRLGLKGYSVFSRTDFFLDMLKGATDHNVDRMFKALMPHVFRSSAKYAPIWYPLSLAKREGIEVDRDALPRRARALLNGETVLAPYPGRRPTNWEEMCFSELLAHHPDRAVNLGIGCKYEVSDVVELQQFLISRLEGRTTLSTELAKLCAHFDRLVYGDGFEGDAAELWTSLGFQD